MQPEAKMAIAIMLPVLCDRGMLTLKCSAQHKKKERKKGEQKRLPGGEGGKVI